MTTYVSAQRAGQAETARRRSSSVCQACATTEQNATTCSTTTSAGQFIVFTRFSWNMFNHFGVKEL